jgi:3',5'-cyclic AMP phosphodiesterase CpdA
VTTSSPVALVVAHLTDTHFGHELGEAAYRTRLVLDELLRMDPRPDVLVHSGDVADHGYAEEYDEAVQVLSTWEGPLVICPGNHDVRAPYVAAFLDGADGPANRRRSSCRTNAWCWSPEATGGSDGPSRNASWPTGTASR